jgi:hypothetical protein
MKLSTRFCGWLVTLIWLVCSAFGFFAAYFLLTFNIWVPQTLAHNFRANRFAVVVWSLAGIAFLTGTFGVLLRCTWARRFSFGLCAIGFCYAVVQTFFEQVLGSTFGPLWGAGLTVALLLISAWLISRSGREYFLQAVQPA